MEALIHLLFTVIKIAILGSIYATSIVLIFLLIRKFKPNSWFALALKDRKKLWRKSGFIISVLIIIYAFTYWGNHGLGDNARIPVGHWKSIYQSNGAWAYIVNSDYNFSQIHINEFAISKTFVCAKIDELTIGEYSTKILIWNLKTYKMKFIKGLDKYTGYAIQNELPMLDAFKSFNKHYRDYWSGWRFWLLP